MIRNFLSANKKPCGSSRPLGVQLFSTFISDGCKLPEINPSLLLNPLFSLLYVFHYPGATLHRIGQQEVTLADFIHLFFRSKMLQGLFVVFI